MAANSIRILTEIASQAGYSEKTRQMYLAALSYAPGMDELDHSDWGDLNRLLESGSEDDIFIATVEILGRQIETWKGLGHPTCHEDWSRQNAMNRCTWVDSVH